MGDNKLGIIVLLVILFFLGKFAWEYVEKGYEEKRGIQREINTSAERHEKRIDKEMEKVWDRRD